MGEVMKTFKYPAVIFVDNETGTSVMAIYDLSLFTEGDTVEEAHKKMEELLATHMSIALKNNLTFNEPTPFNTVVANYPKQICVLVDAKLDNKNNPIM